MEEITMGVRDARRLGMVEAAIKGKVTGQDGAEALGLSRRQFRRLCSCVRREGPKGILHGNLGRVSGRQLPRKVRRQIENLLVEPPERLNDCHLADLLAEEGTRVSAESVRRVRLALGIPAKRRRRPPVHRRRREREARMGEMVLLDGTPFRWLGPDQPPLCLLGAQDDATGAILALTLRPTEDLHGYAVLMREVFLTHGLPVKFYGDGTGVLVRTDEHWTMEEELAGRQRPPQMGQVLEELGIRYIRARSPQAKGRVERLWATLQDRLAAELRLKGVHTLAKAGAYLHGFIVRFNRRFAVIPREHACAWRKAPRHLDQVLACRYSRVVARDNTVSIPGRSMQVPPGPHRRSWTGCRVEVRELLDGRMRVLYQQRSIAEQPAPDGAFELLSRRSPASRQARLEEKGPTGWLREQKPQPPKIGTRPSERSKEVPVPQLPATSHPWRRWRGPNPPPAKAGTGGT